MTHRDKAALAEFVTESGRLFGTTLAAEWRAPESVELFRGVLTMRTTLQYWSRGKPGPLIRPPQGLLNSFISLAGVTNEIISARGLARMASPSDEKICAFATRYGGLQIFCRSGRKMKWPAREHLEYCDVWRYFAQVMGVLVRIAAEFYHGRSGSKEDWGIIHSVPPVMRETAHQSTPGPLHPFPDGDEQNWLSIAHFVDRPSQQTRAMFSHLVNTLLGLGSVRPWFVWNEASRTVTRPEITHSSQSLLSQLALQLCLRLAKVDTFLVCTHCQKPYSPVMRAPKAGQRSFCPECRREGIPKRYASKDFRKRQRQARDGERA